MTLACHRHQSRLESSPLVSCYWFHFHFRFRCCCRCRCWLSYRCFETANRSSNWWLTFAPSSASLGCGSAEWLVLPSDRNPCCPSTTSTCSQTMDHCFLHLLEVLLSCSEAIQWMPPPSLHQSPNGRALVQSLTCCLNSQKESSKIQLLKGCSIS